MKKGFRIFKRKLKKIKKLIISEEYLKLIEYILFLIQKNIEILVDKNGKKTINQMHFGQVLKTTYPRRNTKSFIDI